ncbi:MAG TPA: ImmA/IrrE family metallo-endopeptidase [Acidimicrobiales bacterium]
MDHDYAELLEALGEGVAALTTSERWTQYLDVQSRFPRYSSNNALLILAQKPDATRVAGYKAWQALGHQVVAKESALRIFAPMKYQKNEALEGEKTSEIRGFKLVPVFDVSQTEGPDLPDIVSKLNGLAPEGVFEKLTGFADDIGFRVERPSSLKSGANGDTNHSEGLIRVASNNPEAQQVKTLAHEIGHALLHDPGLVTNKDLSRALKELEAESTAYVICRALAMDTSDYSFGYVVGWAGGGEQALQGIKASTGRIQRAAAAVLKTFEVAEPVVEAVNVVSAGVSIEQWRDVTAVLDAGERWAGDSGEAARRQQMADASAGRISVISIDLSCNPESAGNFAPLDAGEFDGPAASAPPWHELGI